MDSSDNSITCPSCGEKNYAGLRNCVVCGHEFSAESSQNLSEKPSSIQAASWTLKDLVLGVSVLLFLVFLSRIPLTPFNSLITQITLWFLAFIYMFFYPVYLFKKRSVGLLLKPITIKSFFKEVLLSILFYVLIALSIRIIVTIIESVSHAEAVKNSLAYALKLAPNSKILITIAIIGITFGPIVEELFFRGFLYNALKSRFSIYTAALLQAIFFSLMHQKDMLGSIRIFLVGIALVVVYEKRKTLLSPILVHIIINSFILIPALFLVIENHHVPAKTWEEASTAPEWFIRNPIGEIKQQGNGMKQWEYAISTWGSKGSLEWKKEANAFNAVCVYYPEDKKDCAKARIGIIAIYYQHLNDYRRAIIESDKLIAQFPGQRKQLASALAHKGWAYYMLKDYKNSKAAFNNVVNNYKDYKSTVEYAQKGLEMIKAKEMDQN